MSVQHITFIGFGEVGQTLSRALINQQAKTLTISAYDPKFHDQNNELQRIAQEIGVRTFLTASQAVEKADLVICAVTAAQTFAAVQSVHNNLANAAWYLDVNSASPATKIRAAKTIDQAGGRYIEASIMSPINPKRLEAPILLGGLHGKSCLSIIKTLGFSGAKFFDEQPGKTAAAKLCRSVVIKGMEALITESLLAARHYGVEDEVLSSLGNLFPHPDWQAYAAYMMARTLEHGGRRAEEMDEAAITVADAGVCPSMSNATVSRQRWAGDLSVTFEGLSLSSLLDEIHALAKVQSSSAETQS